LTVAAPDRGVNDPALHTLAWGAALVLPVLIYTATVPSATLANQLAALAGWGLVALLLRTRGWAGAMVCSAALSATAAVWAAAAAWQIASGRLPLGLGLGLAGSAVLVAALAGLGAAAARSAAAPRGLFEALVLAGTCSAALGAQQALAPAAISADWLASTSLPGRAVGQLRQPNHLATLLLWSIAALVPLFEQGVLSRSAARRVLGFVLLGVLVLGVVLSGSRTGLLAMGLLLLWAVVDRRLSLLSRAVLVAAPVLALVFSLGLSAEADESGGVGIGARRPSAGGDWSSSRMAIWRDTWDLIVANPWTGVGVGDYNFAWSLSVFPNRPTAFFDHSHNLPLQLWVELGLPLGTLVLLLLVTALWQAARRSWALAGETGVASRTALVLVLLMVPHSLAEYPLWYLHFLLPTAFFWGWCLGAVPAVAPMQAAAQRGWAGTVIGGAMLAAAAFAWWDYGRVVAIYQPGDHPAPLAERIAEGRRSVLFAHHADYALVTTPAEPVTLPGAFDRVTHFLLDTRLMIAWAQSLHARGHEDHARHIAARLREFGNPKSAEFFAECERDASLFQCQPPKRVLSWRDFKGL
jgi:O-antigen ligase